MTMRCLLACSLVLGCGKDSDKKERVPPPDRPPAAAIDAAPAPPPTEPGAAGLVGAYTIEIAIPADYSCRVKPELAQSFTIATDPADADALVATGLTWTVAEVRSGGRPGALHMRTTAKDNDDAELLLQLQINGTDVAGIASYMVKDEALKCEIIKAAKVKGARTPPSK
jgi:hypothetical protein